MYVKYARGEYYIRNACVCVHWYLCVCVRKSTVCACVLLLLLLQFLKVGANAWPILIYGDDLATVLEGKRNSNNNNGIIINNNNNNIIIIMVCCRCMKKYIQVGIHSWSCSSRLVFFLLVFNNAHTLIYTYGSVRQRHNSMRACIHVCQVYCIHYTSINTV